jgi:predicted kinase
MPTCYFTIGNIGEKKSTWAREKVFKEFSTVIISRDSLREMVFGQYGFKNEIEPVIREMSHCNAVIALRQGLDVIMDETYMSRKKRTESIVAIKKLLVENNYTDTVRFVYVYFGSTKEGLARRQADPRNIKPEKWTEIWEGLNSIHEPPTHDEGVHEIVDMRPAQTMLDKMRLYCAENNLPFVMPDNYMCPSCRQSFRHLVRNDETRYITSCPICKHSFLGG